MATQQESMRTVLEKMLETDPKAALEAAMAETERVRAIAKPSVKLDRQGRITEADMDGLYRMGLMYSRTQLVPEHFRGKAEDCAIACGLAMRWGLDPLMVMQSSYIVHGRPGIEGKLMIALLNSSGKIKGRLRFRLEGEGNGRKCTCTATDSETGEVVSAEVTWAMAEAEGWTKDGKTKSGATIKSKWNTLPDLMFQYRSATFLARVNYPEVLMGLKTTDEIEDTVRSEPELPQTRTLDDVQRKLREEMQGLGVSDHTGPMPSDEELAKEEKPAIVAESPEMFRERVERRYARCESQEELNAVVLRLTSDVAGDAERQKIVNEAADERERELDEDKHAVQ